jgi:signal transduction histidine kinase
MAVADLAEFVPASDQPAVSACVNQIAAAPGPGVLVWGKEGLILAYNRGYRAFAALRVSALCRPLFKVQPELERPLRAKIDQVFQGHGVALEAGDTGSGKHAGMLLPVLDGAGAVRGAFMLLVDTAPTTDPLLRVLSGVSHDLRDALVGIHVLTERLARAPKLTPERAAGDLGRILEMTRQLEWMADDISSFSRLTGGNAAQVNLRASNLGAIVEAACEELASAREDAPPTSRPITGAFAPIRADAPPPKPAAPLRVNVTSIQGMWDPDVIRRTVINLVTYARKHGGGGEVRVELTSTREGAVLLVRGEGRSIREDEVEALFEPWRKAPVPGERRPAAGLALFVAREMVQAHGGKISIERSAGGGLLMRVTLPLTVQEPSSRRP